MSKRTDDLKPDLKPGDECEVVTRHIFRGKFVRRETDGAGQVTHVVFDDGARGKQGRPVYRRVPIANFAGAIKR